MLFITTKKGNIIIYDNIKQKIIKEIKSEHSGINCICLGYNEDFIVTGGNEMLKVWNISNFENVLTYKVVSKITHCEFINSFLYYSDTFGLIYRRTLL
jgi:WD40 repeat protein